METGNDLPRRSLCQSLAAKGQMSVRLQWKWSDLDDLDTIICRRVLSIRVVVEVLQLPLFSKLVDSAASFSYCRERAQVGDLLFERKTRVGDVHGGEERARRSPNGDKCDNGISAPLSRILQILWSLRIVGYAL